MNLRQASRRLQALGYRSVLAKIQVADATAEEICGALNADSRLSLEERYGTATRYVEHVRAATVRLQQAIPLLPREAERLVRQAEQRDLGLPK